MYENWTISNQNKNVEFIFGHRILINHVFFGQNFIKTPTGTDRKTQKEKKNMD